DFGTGLDARRCERRPQELPVAAHPEEQRSFADAHLARDVRHAPAVLGHAPDGFEFLGGGIARPAHRAPRRRCSDAVMPKRARNARAKLQGLSKPQAADTSITGSEVVASSVDARSRRIAAAYCCGRMPYTAWKTLLK